MGKSSPTKRAVSEEPIPTESSVQFQIVAERERARQIEAERHGQAKRQMWHAHHWPDDYGDHCFKVGNRHVCRRCASLYPLGFMVAFASALGYAPWPTQLDPALIWILCIPATIAFVGEELGWFSYSPRWQVLAMAVTAIGFGRALGYELVERWSSEFWGPVAVFGGIWFFASNRSLFWPQSQSQKRA